MSVRNNEQGPGNHLDRGESNSQTVEPGKVDVGKLGRGSLLFMAQRLLKGPNIFSTSISSPTPPALLDSSLSVVIANREGLDRSKPSSFEIDQATLYLVGLIATYSGFGSKYSITKYLVDDQIKFLGGGEGFVTIAKMRGCKIRFIDCPNHEFRLIRSISDLQVIFDRGGKLIYRSFTSPLTDIANYHNYSLPNQINFETVKALFSAIASSYNSGKSKEDPIHALIELETASGNVILSIVFLSSPLQDTNQRNQIIHARRRDLLPHSIKEIEMLRQYFRGRELEKVSRVDVMEAIDYLLGSGVGAVGDAPVIKTVMEILDKIPEFKRLTFSDKVAIFAEFINTVWLGTGNFAQHNSPGYGLNARVAEHQVIAEKVGLASY